MSQVELRVTGKFRSWAALRRLAGLALLLLFAGAPGAAAQTAADLALVLAVDASGSVDQIRFELQKRGYVAAFRHARVLQAIRSGPNRAIAVTWCNGRDLRCRFKSWDGASWVTKKAPPRLRRPSSVRRANSSAAAPPSAAPSITRRRCLQRVHFRRAGASSTFPATARTTAAAR